MPDVIPLIELLRIFSLHQIELIVVGGVSAVLNGAPVATFDLDILHRRTPENIARMMAALSELDAVYRADPRQLRPGVEHLAGPGHHLLTTRLGAVDVLGSIEAGVEY